MFSRVKNAAPAVVLAGTCLLILGMPVSTAAQETGGAVACIAVFVCLCVGPFAGQARRFPLRWLYIALLGYFLFNILLSVHPLESASVFRAALHRGFLLFLVGLELARRDFFTAAVIWAFALMGFYEGLDGVWQYFSGRDFFKDDPWMAGRLTGSFSTYRVGNLMALTLAGSLALPWCMPSRPLSFVRNILPALLLWGPALFLLIFAQARSGYICLLGALCAVYALHRGLFPRWLLPLAGIVAGGMLFGADRISLDAVLRDGRLKELWPFAWRIFMEYPLFGSGIGTYGSVLPSLGIVPGMHSPNIGHPHNIYLQLLAETGLCGFTLFCLFVGLLLFRSMRRIRASMRTPPSGDPALPMLRIKAAAFWGASFGYLLMGVSAHSLFRTWWLSLGFLLLGLTAGSALRLSPPEVAPASSFAGHPRKDEAAF